VDLSVLADVVVSSDLGDIVSDLGRTKGDKPGTPVPLLVAS